MASVNYDAKADEHQSVLIIVKPIGQDIPAAAFQKVFDRLSRMNYVKVLDKQSPGWQRGIWVNYLQDYSQENNEWGDFQAHRKVLGLISVGKCTDPSKLQDLCKSHTKLQEEYNSTLYDSRCMIFGLTSSDKVPKPTLEEGIANPSDSILAPESVNLEFERDNSNNDQHENSSHKDIASVVTESDIKLEFEVTNSSGVTNEPESSPSSVSDHQSSTSPYDTTSPSDPSPETEGTDMPNSDPNIKFYSSHDSSSDSDSPQPSRHAMLPTKIEMIPGTGTSRGTPCIQYGNFDECEKLELDIYEFISSVFFVLESKRLSYIGQDKQLKQEKYPLLKAPYENKDLVGVDLDTKNFKKKCLGRMRKHIGDICLQVGLPVEALTMYLGAVDTLKSASDWLWLASAYEGQCAASIALLHPPQNRSLTLQRNASVPLPERNTMPKARNSFNVTLPSRSLPSGLNPSDVKALGRNMLTHNEITEKYKEAFEYYSKTKNTFYVGIECCIKAARVHVLLERHITAAYFVQNIVFSNLQQTEEDKLKWFCTLAELYTELGFHRKAAFFKWIAATRYGALPVDENNASKPYYLILETFDGYQLSLDPKELFNDRANGWPRVQIQVLLELIAAAKRMNNQPLAVRHTSFLLFTMFNHLSPAERKDYCTQLEALASKCEGGPVPLALETGLIIPPVNFLNLPLVKSMKLQSLAPHLRPVKLLSRKLTPQADKMGPFIFSPLMMHRDQNVKTNKLDFKWVEGDVCEVSLQVYNPLPFELRVSHMGLMAKLEPAVESLTSSFESFPACLSLPAESGPYPVNLLGTPRASGELHILGYTTHVLGVKNNCKLKELKAIKENSFIIDVIPCLPQLQLSTSLPKSSVFSSLGDTSHVVMNAAVSLYSGESRECNVTLKNIGKESVEKVDITLQTKLGKDVEPHFFSWSKENLDTQLPIEPGQSASFTIYIHAVTGFVQLPENKISNKKEKVNRSTPAGSPSISPRYRKRSTEVVSPEPYSVKTVEAVIQMQYTGGPGMQSNYGRQCAVALTVEVIPSLVITKWDVLPAEISSHCYLVLDIFNATKYEMELQYAPNKFIGIEAQDTCRIPVPVERCPLEMEGKSQNLKSLCKKHLASLVDLQWTLPCLELEGKAWIADIPWTSSMIDGILMSPIQWEIFLCDRPFKFEDEFSFKIGEMITLSVILNNLSDRNLKSLCLRVSGYQDYQNGHKTYRLETKRAIVGTDRVVINEVYWNMASEDDNNSYISKLRNWIISKNHQENVKKVIDDVSQKIEENAPVMKDINTVLSPFGYSILGPIYALLASVRLAKKLYPDSKSKDEEMNALQITDKYLSIRIEQLKTQIKDMTQEKSRLQILREKIRKEIAKIPKS